MNMVQIKTETISLPNQALTWMELDKIEILSKPLILQGDGEGTPAPPTGCVLVRIKATGICGSDVSSSLPEFKDGGPSCF